ncbi:MAG: phosphatase PAP2 family protein [Bacteroidetes bacterium]|nr:phosphatase PAP2 family protein [Bacteroidota bacterium]
MTAFPSMRLLWLLAAFPLCIIGYAAIDLPMAEWLHANVNGNVHVVAAWLEEIGRGHWWLVPSLLGTIVFWKRNRPLAIACAVVFLSIALSGLAANLLKIIICRARPVLWFDEHLYGFRLFAFETDYVWNSFPSGHATTGAALAVTGRAVWRKGAWLFTLVGISIAIARIVITAHYFSDVVIGAALGVLFAWVAQRIMGRMNT